MVKHVIRMRSFALAAMLGGAAALPAPSALAATEDANSYASDAQKLIDKGDLKGAEIQLRNAVRANPEDPGAHIQLGNLYLRTGNFGAAEAEAREAASKGADDEQVAPLLAMALLRQNKVAQLVQQVQPANREEHAESGVRLALGLAHLELRENDEAEPLLKDAARLDPDAWEPKLALARLAMVKGDVAEGKRELATAAALQPDNIEILRFQGEILRATGDNEGALVVFNKILAQHPDDLATLTSRANVLIDQNNVTDAQRDIDHALKIAPNSIAAIYLDALLMAKQGNLDKADDLLTKVSGSFPSLVNGYYLQGAVKYALGQYEQAEASLSKYLARYPNQPGVRRLLASIALRKNDRNRAIELLKPVVQDNPTDAATLNLLAQAYVGAGQKDQAVELYERAAAAEPADTKAQASAALMQMRFGNASEGVADLEKIATTDKGADVATPLIVLGDLQTGKLDEAATTAEALVKREPDDSVAQNLLGSVRMAQDRLPDAQAIFEALIKKDGSFLAARRNLAEVFVAMKRNDDAKKAWLDVLKTKPGDERAMLGLAQIAVQQDDVPAAADWLKQAGEAAPKDITPGLQLVGLYGKQKDWDDALKAAQDLEARFPFNPRVVDLAAGVRAGSGDTAGAATEFSALAAHFPDSAPVLQRYAVYQERAGDKEGARASLAKAVEIAPTDPRYMGDLVKLDYGDKGADAALATARSFAAAAPETSDLLAAEVLANAKRLPEAIDTLQRARQEHPTSAVTVQLANLTYASGKHDDATAMLQSWLQDHDGDVAARLALANQLLSEHDDDKAQAAYERVRDVAPNNVIALNNLAWLYAKKRDPRAQDLARQAFRLAPSGQTADTLGWVLVSAGEAGTALPYLKDAGAALPNDATVQYHLAAALKATGDTAQARSVLEAVLKANTVFDDKDAAQRLLDELKRG